MIVSLGKTVSLEYTLQLHPDDHNTVIDSNVGSDPLSFVHGSQHIISGLEQALTGMTVGERKRVCVPPEEGYGAVQESAFQEIDKTQLPAEGLIVGTVLETQELNGEVLHPRVAEVKEQSVILDFNHPLAGKTLFFNIKILKVE